MAQPLHTLVPGSTETPTLRCKTCKVPLPDAKRKNCDRCRQIRTEKYHRWQRSVEARKNNAKNPIPIPTLETHPSSAPPSNVNIKWTNPATTAAASAQPVQGASTPAQLTDTFTSTSLVSLDPNPNKRSYYREHTASSQLPRDTPRLILAMPHGIDIPEYQWGEELVNALMALPPRSNFVGQFSVVADPDVDNSKRAQMFLDQLRSKGLPTTGAHRSVSGDPGALRGHAIGLNCRCRDGCQGRFIVSVDDDTTHIQGVPGQRIGVALLHASK
ncbi:hypothetical protein V8E53_013146 [Lactarius tabidus]